MYKMLKINDCERCGGQGIVMSGTLWGECPDCMGIGEEVNPKNCESGTHNHCEDYEYNGETLVVCHDCKAVMRKCEVYSRVVGYLRPVSGWNKGKQQEFSERKPYKIAEGKVGSAGSAETIRDMEK